MSDQKPEDNITLNKSSTEEENLFTSLQDDFDTLLANETCGSIDHLDALDNEYELPLDIQANSAVKDDLDALEMITLSTEKSTEREPIEADFFAEINSSTMPNRANESMPVATPPPRPAGKSKWVSLSFITISLAAISLAFWLKLIPIDSGSEIATNSSADMIATPPPAPIQQPGHKKTVAVPMEKVATQKPVPAVSKTTGGNNNWAVILSSVSSEKAAIQQQARMRVRGVNTQYVQSLNDGRLSYLIHVGGFSNRLEAEKQSSILSKKLGMRDAWVNRL